MFFDKVSLSKDAWHYRLQNWTFGSVPYTNNFCPFFWLTIFCLIISPFVGGYRSAAWLGSKCLDATVWVLDRTFFPVLEGIESACDSWYVKKIEVKAINLSDDAALRLFEFMFYLPLEEGYRPSFHTFKFDDLSLKKRKRYKDTWNAWKDDHEDWKERLLEIKEVRKGRRVKEHALKAEQEVAAEKATVSRKKLFAFLIKFTRYVAIAAIAAIGFGFVYGIIALGFTVVIHWYAIVGFFGHLASGVFFIGPYVGITLAFLFVGYFLLKLLKMCMSNVSLPSFLFTPLSPPRFVSKFGSKISGFFGFFVVFIKAFKEDNCPGIEWEEKTESE